MSTVLSRECLEIHELLAVGRRWRRLYRAHEGGCPCEARSLVTTPLHGREHMWFDTASGCLPECFGAFGSRSDGSLPSQEVHSRRMRSKQGNKVAANHEYIVGCAIHLDRPWTRVIGSARCE